MPCPEGMECECSKEWWLTCCATAPLSVIPLWGCLGAYLRQKNHLPGRSPSFFISCMQFSFCSPCAIFRDINRDTTFHSRSTDKSNVPNTAAPPRIARPEDIEMMELETKPLFVIDESTL